MPIFEFECNRCDRRFEELMRRTDPTPPCPECGGEDVRRLISNTSFQLKGTGWYVSDYPSTHRQGKGTSEKADSDGKKGDGAAEKAAGTGDGGGAGAAASSEKPSGNSVTAA